MRTIVPLVVAFACLVLLSIGMMAAATYTEKADFKNQTDSFGTVHTQEENQTATAVSNLAKGSSSTSSGFLIIAAVFVIIGLIVAAVALTKRPKW